MPYTQEQLNAAVKRGREGAAAGRTKGRVAAKGELRRSLSIPPELYWNAVKGRGRSPKDRDYWNWEARQPGNEFLRVHNESIPTISLQHLTPPPGPPVKRRNRFGVVKFHKSYG